ncbi:hypothetical protein BCE75_10616 [Isoptericola sp. CG 20/1183]|uniref:DUF559 domain-containing protein n=1 Tax=Isoptericola halotolerans TaxID=300560 RepID=A0ABX5EDQ8_9MICO|nr:MULTISPECIES: hypothetical protein [Isoptericola]PRZ06543.1 hypothetical protein BCL65_106218 [Isoptericola halotolerans]PRZ06651.1 hypothetical protein BCE75_10616 [Isoptericola sp. CG 20/1183]
MRTFAPIPESLLAVAEAQEGLVAGRQCDEHGVGSSRRSRLVRSGRWLAVTRGVFDTCAVRPAQRTVELVPARPVPPLLVSEDVPGRSRTAREAALRRRSPADLLHDHRRRRAAWAGLLAYGGAAIAVGTSALALHGIEGVPGRITPQVTLPDASARRQHPGVVLRQFDDGMTVVPFGDDRSAGRHLASVEWALAQSVPELWPASALAVLDSALRLEALDRAGLERAHDHARGRRGVAARHVAWELADGRSASPLESAGRWQCHEWDVLPDTLQLPVLDPDGRLLGVGDLAWFRGGGRVLVVEMDGFDWHDGSARGAARDRDRDNDFARHGVDVLRFAAEHVRRDVVGRDVSRFLSARRASRF